MTNKPKRRRVQPWQQADAAWLPVTEVTVVPTHVGVNRDRAMRRANERAEGDATYGRGLHA